MEQNYLVHHGVKGQKWGVRRYQNDDGSLTEKGRKKYGVGKINSKGQYVSTNGTKIAKSNSATINVMRRASITAPGRVMSALGTPAMARMTGRSKESINKQAAREIDALKEYYRNGGDKMFSKGLGKAENRRDRALAYERLQNQASTKDKLIFNNATRKLAAKYVVNNNMSVDEATKKSKQAALRNTAAFMAAYGAITYAQLRSMR